MKTVSSTNEITLVWRGRRIPPPCNKNMMTEVRLSFDDTEIESSHGDLKAPEREAFLSSLDKPAGFWERQFQPEPTMSQRRFDWAYGVIIPLICVAADPIVFRHQGMLSAYQPFAYS